MLLTLAGPASALTDEVNRTSSLIASVAPMQGVVLDGDKTESGFQFGVSKSKFDIPSDPTQPIVVGDAASKETFAFHLPDEVNLGNAKKANDGTIVYKGKGKSADAAVQVLEDGSARIQTIIQAPNQPHEFTYSFDDGFTPMQAEDGSVFVGNFAADGDGSLAKVDTPWARDAKGKAVPTRYEIRGNSLVQVVTPSSDTTYPVVADPRWKWYAAAYGAKFNKAETNDIANAGSAMAVCGLMWAFPPLAAVCAAFGGSWVANATIARGNKECIFIAVVPAPISYRYKDGDCF
ncbi:hypothetical protein [Neomicrococcus lactis]|uniref:hypothetical protein n=1 Tax=Neomicrococcus lactis TaxID=732241 RepID=UPI002301DB6E|nr:hypothetical protein [Neomicrococcus lactis]